MAEHGGHAPSTGAKKSSGHRREVIAGLTEGMFELMDGSGLGAFRDAPNTIGQLFGAEGKGGSSHGHGPKHK